MEISIKLKEKSGIYCIFNIVSGNKYIGSSNNIYERWNDHFRDLLKNKHCNQYLQNAWNKYGKDSFMFEVLEYCNLEVLYQREQYFIDTMNPEYNIVRKVVDHGKVYTSQSTKEKISNTLKEKYASGEITTYRQDHLQVKVYLYNIQTLTLEGVFNSKVDCCAYLGYAQVPGSFSECSLIKEKYVISFQEIVDREELYNLINCKVLKYIKKQQKTTFSYLVVENADGDLYYYRSIQQCADSNNCSRSTLSKHIKSATKDTPYILNNKRKMYTLNEYIRTHIPTEPSL